MMRERKGKVLSGLLLLTLCCSCVFPFKVDATNALDVITDVKMIGTTMRNAAKAVADYHKLQDDIAATKKNLALAEQNLFTVQKERLMAEAALQKAEAQVTIGEDRRARAEAEEKKKSALALQATREEAAMQKKLAKLKTDWSRMRMTERRLEKQQTRGLGILEKKSESELAKIATQVLEEIGYDGNRLEEAEKRMQALALKKDRNLNQTEADYERQLQRVGKMADDLERRLDQVKEKLDLIMEKKTEAKEAKQELQEATQDLLELRKDKGEVQNDFMDQEENLRSAEEDVVSLRTDLVDAIAQLSPPEQSRYFQTESRYYSWQDDLARSGYQFYQPLDLYLTYNSLEFGLSTGYVRSNNKSFARGRISTWLDTKLHIGKRDTHKKYTLLYSLDINVPTGKSKIHRETIMSDDLVGLSRFGEGWNWTPGIAVSHKVGERDTWTMGTSYSFRGNYEYDTDYPGAKIYPGNEWRKFMEWLHADQKWQTFTAISHTSYGKTQENGLDYQEGSNWDLGVYYNRILSKSQDLLLYYRYTIGDATDYLSPVMWDTEDGNEHRRYYGVEWRKQLSPVSAMRLMLHKMETTGNSYDPLTYLNVTGRERYGAVAGYELSVSPDSTVSIDLEWFQLKDDVQNGKSHGFNAAILFSTNF